MRLLDPSKKQICSCLSLLCLQLSVLASSTPATAGDTEPVSSGPHAVQLAVGPWSLVDQDLRDALGTGIAIEFAYAAKLRADRGPWLDVSLGYQKSSGPLLDRDPTFELDDSELTVIPFSIGIRGLLAPDWETAPVRIYAGVGVTWAGTRWSTHFKDPETNSTFGGYVELRPEVRIGERVHLLLRQRLLLLADSRFDDSSMELNASGLALSAGIRYDIWGGE